MSELKISLTESQYNFLNLECDFPLFVGGPGCGKSFLLGLKAVQDALHSPLANIYIYAPENHHIRTIEVPNVLYWLEMLKIKNKGYNKQESCVITEDPRCGNFYFKNMETAATMVGYESYRAHVDELDTLDSKKAEEIWRAIIMRNRQQPKGVSQDLQRFDKKKNKWYCINRANVYTTPEGYNFCYKNWELVNHEDYKQVKGHTEDNPALPSKYVEAIRDRYPAHIAEAYLHGEFVNMQSLTVYYNYDPDLHNSFEEVTAGEPVYIGCDFNVDNTSATVYVKRNGKEWHAVDEYTGVRDAATLAELLKSKYKCHKVTVYPDSSGSSRSNANASNRSSIQELQARGFIIKANKKNFLIQDRVNATNKAFREGKLFINQRKCPTVSRCLVNQPYDRNNLPCKKTGYDHQNDATTYPIIFEMGLQKPIFPINFSWVS